MLIDYDKDEISYLQSLGTKDRPYSFEIPFKRSGSLIIIKAHTLEEQVAFMLKRHVTLHGPFKNAHEFEQEEALAWAQARFVRFLDFQISRLPLLN